MVYIGTSVGVVRIGCKERADRLDTSGNMEGEQSSVLL